MICTLTVVHVPNADSLKQSMYTVYVIVSSLFLPSTRVRHDTCNWDHRLHFNRHFTKYSSG